jgi:Spy/CpxP family protein refolding chaperone
MTRVVVILGFLVAFGAGLVVGMKPRHAPPGPTTRTASEGGWLAAELRLTPEQQAEMKKIWSGMAARGEGPREDRRGELLRERDAAIAALVRPEDKARYDQIQKDFADKTAALDSEFRAAFQNSVERTKQILTLEQRTKYEELLRHHEWDHGPREGHRGTRGHERRGEHPASKPASQP